MYVPSISKIISSYDVVFDESFSSKLAYTPQHYEEAMAVRPSVAYISCAASPRVSDNKLPSSNSVKVIRSPVFSL